MTDSQALIERIKAARRWSDTGPAMMCVLEDTLAALDAEVVERAFIEGLWAGWASGLANEQMSDAYAARSWSSSDARAALSALKKGEAAREGEA